MAAAKIGRSPSLGNERPMTKTRGILLETMQLVEPKKRLPVPNHLLETKIYSKIAQNSVVQARPAVLHFGGFELGRTHQLRLQLANVSTEVQRMHVIPPQTKYFYVRYNKNDRLVPGLTLDCTVEFTPDEWRYYYDCIRIHTKGEENLIIPIHAYPVMSADDFPSQLTFPPVPVGHKMTKAMPLRCNVPIDFEFQLSILQPHAAFQVHPMAGVVPASGEVGIMVTFSPSEFSTAHMTLQLLVSQFNAKPLTCQVSGSSAPGLATELTLANQGQAYDNDDDEVMDPRCITPIELIRQRRQQQKSPRLPMVQKSMEVEYAGIKFPANLDTPYSVAQVLLQEPGKLRMKDIREAVMAKKADGVGSTRQMKEAIFEMAVRQDVYEERQNQLRWQVKLGEDQMTEATQGAILDSRQQAWEEYKRQRGDPDIEEEYRRSKTQCTFRRTARDVSELAQEGVKFDLYTNDLWAVRHSSLSMFQQAVRKTILRKRADKNIKLLRQNLLEKNKKSLSVMPAEEEKQTYEDQDSLLEVSKVKSITFPAYSPPDVKDDMAVDALGVVPFKPTEVFVKEKVPYFELKVPQQYRLHGYCPHHVHQAAGNYVPPNLVKPLRSGAEDEIVSLPPPPPIPALQMDLTNEGDMSVEDVTAETPAPATQTEVVALMPPAVMFEPIEFPALHVFNPAPGLQVFQAPLPYSETDSDFHLCPLPRYISSDVASPHMTTQKRYLDREDVIKGVMAWKRFPSQGLTSLAITPTLTNVWVPRWNDAFSEDLLPTEVPILHDSIPDEDKENLLDDGEEDDSAVMSLVPDMVNAQFPLVDASAVVQTDEKDKSKKEDNFPIGNKMPATNIPVSGAGPVAREKREQELEFFIQKKYNRLGKKFHARIATLDTLKTDTNLILK